MWRPSESAEDDVSDLPRIDPQNKRRRSRRHAWRDGLADQTVVQELEHVRSYRTFERALTGRIDPRSVLELAPVHRLASLLWRLRRANAIETGLFEIQGELLIASRQDLSRGPSQRGTPPSPTRANGHSKVLGLNGQGYPPDSDQEPLSTSIRPPLGPRSKSRAIAQCFLRLSHLDPTLFDRAGSYEGRLWRQATQTVWTLDAMRRPPSAPARRPFRKPTVLSYWDAEGSGMGWISAVDCFGSCPDPAPRNLEHERRAFSATGRPLYPSYPNAAGTQTPEKLTNRRFGRVETV